MAAGGEKSLAAHFFPPPYLSESIFGNSSAPTAFPVAIFPREMLQQQFFPPPFCQDRLSERFSAPPIPRVFILAKKMPQEDTRKKVVATPETAPLPPFSDGVPGKVR